MIDPTMEKKAASVFPTTFPGAPVIYLNTYSDEGKQVFDATQAVGCPPFSLVAVSDLAWSHDMAPWNSPAAFKKGSPLPAGRTTTCGYWWRRSYPEQKKTRPVLRRGGELLGTRWPGYSLCMPSIGRMCSHGWGVCPDPCSFQVSRNTSSPTSRSVSRTASTSPWGTGRPRPAIRF